jgi:hypothetical protein
VLADKYLEEHRARLVAEADRDAARVRGLALTSSAGNVRKVPRNRTLPKASSANSGVIANG